MKDPADIGNLVGRDAREKRQRERLRGSFFGDAEIICVIDVRREQRLAMQRRVWISFATSQVFFVSP